MIYLLLYLFFFFFKQKTAYEMAQCDWSSDVCSSDLDPGDKDWYVYGQGKVTADGKQIVPEPGVGVYEFTGAMVAPSGLGPLLAAIVNGLRAGDPVDVATGLFVMEKTDLASPDTLPLGLTRTYRQNDSRSRPFGIGATHPYEIFLVGDMNPYTFIDLI